MSRARYVWREGIGMVEAHLAPPKYPPGKRSDLACPAIRPDGMGDTMNMADGKLYDSRSAYDKAVKAAGCHIVGDDPAYTDPKMPEHKPAPGLGQDIKDAIEQLGGM